MSLQQNLLSSYPNILERCHTKTSEKYFGILDKSDDTNNLPCEVVFDGSIEDVFKVLNNDGHEINFIAIDHCVFDDSGPRKCDGVLFTDAEISFIEIKKTTSRRGQATSKKNAYEQLESTINIFEGDGVFKNIKLNKEAIVCILGKETYPATLSENLERAKYFVDNYGVDLKIGTLKKY